MQLKDARYFLNEREVPEQEAANEWFHYAENHGTDVARAISLWEDAVTPEGDRSRKEISPSGIRVVPPER